MTTRWKLTIEYDGSAYSGWQRQENAPSVQQAIEEAILGFSGQDVRIHAAGRTDAGVHANGQVAHVDLEDFSKPMDGFEVAKAINAYLRDHAISVYHAEIVDEEFHARFNATNKLYRYKILNRPGFPALDENRVWHFKRHLDVPPMQEAAQYLLGNHDFSTFRAAECQAKSPVRTLDRLDIIERPYDGEGGTEIIFELEAQSFLHHQVRNFVGTLALVGEGKWKPEDIKSALEAKDRTQGGPTAPADGLYLVRVDY